MKADKDKSVSDQKANFQKAIAEKIKKYEQDLKAAQDNSNSIDKELSEKLSTKDSEL